MNMKSWLLVGKIRGFPGDSEIQNPAASAGDTGDMVSATRGQEDLLEEGMATHSNILAWKFVDKGASQPTVHGVVELDTTERLSTRSGEINTVWEHT